ncbi:unnamed protein product, partial [Meganyctiphanes norvegica]
MCNMHCMHNLPLTCCLLTSYGCRGVMASARLVALRGSLVLNGILVLYLCAAWLSKSPTHQTPIRALQNQLPTSNPLQQLGEGVRVVDSAPLEEQGQGMQNQVDPVQVDSNPVDPGVALYNQGPPPPGDIPPPEVMGYAEMPMGRKTLEHEPPQEGPGEAEELPREVQESRGVTEHLQMEPIATDPPDPPLDSQERKMYPDLRECTTKPIRTFYQQRGEYWILENYIPAALSFRCDESITYTTHADYTFLDNLDPLTSRWQGPVSLSVYAPGTDFNHTINTILHLRDCWGEGIKKFVTFHLFFHVSHTPKKIPTTEELLRRKADCSLEPPKWANVTTYRQQKKLLYPVNVARNTARLAAQTYFVFPSDVELYPSTNFIPEFFKLLKQKDFSNSTVPRVFVFSIFEVKENVHPPETKDQLQAMLKKKDAIPFHKNVCAKCHNVPKSQEWQELPYTPGLKVFHIGKRKPPFHKWEPIYVGTNKEPLYDERLSWEGKSDKMTQMYILCVRDYEFHIMDNAFLVHRPGIKKLHKDPVRDKVVAKQNTAIKTKILPEYKTIFGIRKSCIID